MHRRLAIITAVTVTLGAAACGGDDSTGSTTAAPVTALAATTVSPADLDAMLLTATDVGEDWTEGHTIGPEDLSSFAQLPCPDSALNPLIVDRLTAVTGVQFDPVDRSSQHVLELLVTGEPARLSTDLELLAEAALAPCAVDGSTSAGAGGVTVEPMSIPALGDQRMAYTARASESTTGPTWYVRIAVVRVGSVALQLGLTEILATSHGDAHVSDGEFARLLETAVGELSG